MATSYLASGGNSKVVAICVNQLEFVGARPIFQGDGMVLRLPMPKELILNCAKRFTSCNKVVNNSFIDFFPFRFRNSMRSEEIGDCF